jgi:hypothetical protein
MTGSRERRLSMEAASEAIRRARAITDEPGPDNCFRRIVRRREARLAACVSVAVAVRPRWWNPASFRAREICFRRLRAAVRRTDAAIRRHEMWADQTRAQRQAYQDTRIRAVSSFQGPVSAIFDLEARRCERLLADRRRCPTFDSASRLNSAIETSLTHMQSLFDRVDKASLDLASVAGRLRAVDRGGLHADAAADREFSRAGACMDAAHEALARGDLIRGESLISQATWHVATVEQFLARASGYAKEELELWKGVAQIVSDPAVRLLVQRPAVSVGEWQRLRHDLAERAAKAARECRRDNSHAFGDAVHALAWNDTDAAEHQRFATDIVHLRFGDRSPAEGGVPPAE